MYNKYRVIVFDSLDVEVEAERFSLTDGLSMPQTLNFHKGGQIVASFFASRLTGWGLVLDIQVVNDDQE